MCRHRRSPRRQSRAGRRDRRGRQWPLHHAFARNRTPASIGRPSSLAASTQCDHFRRLGGEQPESEVDRMRSVVPNQIVGPTSNPAGHTHVRRPVEHEPDHDVADNVTCDHLAQRNRRTKEAICLAHHDASLAGEAKACCPLRLSERHAEWHLAQHMLALLKGCNRLGCVNAARRCHHDRINVTCTHDLIHRRRKPSRLRGPLQMRQLRRGEAQQPPRACSRASLALARALLRLLRIREHRILTTAESPDRRTLSVHFRP